MKRDVEATIYRHTRVHFRCIMVEDIVIFKYNRVIARPTVKTIINIDLWVDSNVKRYVTLHVCDGFLISAFLKILVFEKNEKRIFSLKNSISASIHLLK